MASRTTWLALVLSPLAMLVGGLPAWGAEGLKPAAVRVGVIQTLFRGLDPAVAPAQAELMCDMIHRLSGIQCEFALVADESEMAKRLQDGDLHIGVLHGIEYAWIKATAPELKPMVLAQNEAYKLKGYVLVRDGGGINAVADLRGKSLSIAARSLNHCHLFLDKCIRDAGHDPAGFFAPSACPMNTGVALDLVADGKADAVVVDGVALQHYRQWKPGRAAKLRVLCESCLFPTAMILHKPGVLDGELVQEFRGNLLSAHEKSLGKQILTFLRLSHFSTVPEDYPPLLDAILKTYPKPVRPAVFITPVAADTKMKP